MRLRRCRGTIHGNVRSAQQHAMGHRASCIIGFVNTRHHQTTRNAAGGNLFGCLTPCIAPPLVGEKRMRRGPALRVPCLKS